MRRNASLGSAVQISLPAILAALSLVLLFFACSMPSGRLGLTAAAGLLPAAAVVSCGLRSGFLCYGATAVLSLLLVSDKGLAVLYAVFFGLYPMVKGLIEKRRCLLLELVLKLLFFNGVLTAIMTVMADAVYALLPWKSLSAAVLYLFANAVFLVYDFGFSKIIVFYQHRIDRVLRKR